MRETDRKTGRTVAVVGLGYVGLPLAVLAARKGFRVLGVDCDQTKVDFINQGRAPFRDPTLTEALVHTQINASTNFAQLATADIVIVCVPTPVHGDYTPDLASLETACKCVGEHIRRNTLVIIESTVNPGICENVVLPMLEKHSGLSGDEDFFLAHCPERINPGDPKWSVENINRVVGAQTTEGLDRAVRFYRSIITGAVHPMGSLKEAEAVKVVENSFRDINIAFVNELAMSFDKMGIDLTNVLAGAATKPFAFMPHQPGCGVGGHCIPVDPYYLIAEGRRNGFDHAFLSLARTINNRMPLFTVDLLTQLLQEAGMEIAGSRIAVLGLAYKADIDDIRESPSRHIIEEIRARGGTPVSYDPYVTNCDVPNLDSALTGAKAAIVATPHREFSALLPDTFTRNGVSIVVDGKNCLCKRTFTEAGIIYRGIGR